MAKPSQKCLKKLFQTTASSLVLFTLDHSFLKMFWYHMKANADILFLIFLHKKLNCQQSWYHAVWTAPGPNGTWSGKEKKQNPIRLESISDGQTTSHLLSLLPHSLV